MKILFKSLSDKLSFLVKNIIKKDVFTENDIQNNIKEIRNIFLEADVSILVVKVLINKIKQKILGKKINKNITLAQKLIKIIYDELILIMHNENNYINLSAVPTIILLLGTHGAGKTTSICKLGNFLNKNYNKKILTVSIDKYRPAASKQLEIMSNIAKINFFNANLIENPIEVINQALNYLKTKFYDILLIDTAGISNVNKNIINEIININEKIKLNEILFVIDSMTGQNAIDTVKKINLMIPITGLILTKIDGDIRGGSALSLKYVLNIPIKFVGTGEKIHELDLFRPKILIKRILGIQNIYSVIKDIENKSTNSNELNPDKLKKNENFNLNDFLVQLKKIRNTGLSNLINKFNFSNQLLNIIQNNISEKQIIIMESIINSMTIKERLFPEIINNSRKKRISQGSGTDINEIDKLLKYFNGIKYFIEKLKINKLSDIIQNIKNIISFKF